uniref:Clavesin-1 n=1 Tax=Cacopsylla melanoneura TaxID=428564 RepID=A0A8D9E2Q0_9HEMI
MGAEDEGSGDPGIRKYNEKELKDMCESVRLLVQGEPTLRCSTTDEFLIRFIKASEYDVMQSFQLIKDYFRAKIENPEAYVVKSPKSKLSYLTRLDLGFPLNGRDHLGRRVLWVPLGDIDPGKESFESICDMILLVLEALSLEEDVQEYGASLILDATNFTLKLMKWCTPYKMKTIMRFLQVTNLH